MLQAIAANIAGILERSATRLAKTAGGATTATDVEQSLARCEAAGLIRWWPDLEILWVVEAADEQCMNPKSWAAVEAVLVDLPGEVRAAFSQRYPDCDVGPLDHPAQARRRPEHPHHTVPIPYRHPIPPGTGTGTGNRKQEQEQEQEQQAPALPEPVPVGGAPPRVDAVGELWLWFEAECLRRQYARKRNALSSQARRRVGKLVTHIRQTLDTDVAGALESQRRHLEYRLETAAKDHDTRSRIHSATPWRPGWWDWWRANVDDAPPGGPQAQRGQVDLLDDFDFHAARAELDSLCETRK